MKRAELYRLAIAFAVIAGFTGAAMAAGPQRGSGSRPSFDKLLSAFDADKNAELSKSEVPGRMWVRLSAADKNGDSIVTRTEYESY